ncbi:hypothetical protein [Mycolicibacterium litorale]|uniref:Uncharacterized protein n=1 Tax=Mycolicibacterium litorale TaxID=758802 RepID=A0AAD1MUN5_9MYCO|nr:hypothetical protein [Mycolicibacterium litorale]MCV7416009.1 hypothetical protein [Mycolicibacterium litorale]BBY17203.1 hypothetical protein MLIT_27950 [Mycolicibacterium litorale]
MTARPSELYVHHSCLRQNLGVIVGGVLRRSAWVVLIVGFAVILTYTLGEDGHPTVILRIVAGVGALALVVMYARVMRDMPGRQLKSVARQRQMLAVRILQLVAAVVLGALTAAIGAMTVPAVAASVLVLPLPVVVIVGAVTGERLW